MNQYLIFDTAFGEAAIIFKERPFVLLNTILPHGNKKDLENRIKENNGGKAGSHTKATLIAKMIKNYFDGKPVKPPWDMMDINRLTPLQQKVLSAVVNIPYGEVRSYGEIAKAIGKPKSSRFVGTTMAKNPYPVLIPCHRVIKSDGTLGQFGGGITLKEKMLALESER